MGPDFNVPFFRCTHARRYIGYIWSCDFSCVDYELELALIMK